MNMRLKKVLDDIQKTENKILELQEHVDGQPKDADFSGRDSEWNSYHAV